MNDKFGNKLAVGDLVLYNECVEGKVVDADTVFVHCKTNPLSYAPQITTVRGATVVNKRGRRTIVTNKNKIVKMTGYPSLSSPRFNK